VSERWRGRAITASIVVMAAFLVVAVVRGDQDGDRALAVGNRIKCPVCQGESIADSPAQMARDMMALVSERVEEGAPDQEIIDELLASYTGALLLDPPLSGWTLTLWLAPVVALAIGALMIWRRTRIRISTEATRVSATPRPGRRRRRAVLGTAAMVIALGVVVATAATLLQGAEPPVTLPEIEEDPERWSNQTMEAVIAANVDHPQIDGMRLALGDRYFEAGDYRSAFPHYFAVAESAQADQAQAGLALTRLGWMAFDGNGDVDTALRLIDTALDLVPEAPLTLFLKGRVIWCGQDDPDAAIALFERALEIPGLDEEVAETIGQDINRAAAGEDC